MHSWPCKSNLSSLLLFFIQRQFSWVQHSSPWNSDSQHWPPQQIFIHYSSYHSKHMGGKTCWGMHEDLITTLICIYHIKLYQWQGRDCSNEDIKITSTLLDKAKYITKYRVVAALSASWWIYRNSELTNSRINDKTKYRFKVQIWRQNEHSIICTAKGIGWTWCSNLGTKVCEVSNTKRG